MRVTVVGAGAIGGLVGGHLAAAGHDVTFVDADAEHVAAINRAGLRISGAAELTATGPALLPSQLGDGLGTVLLAVKARHTRDALAVIAPRLAPDGYVVSLQNGLEEYKIAEAVGAHRTVGALVTFGGYYAGPGEVVYAGTGSFRIGELDGIATPRLAELAALLGEFHPVQATENIVGCLWGKEALGALYFATALVSEDVITIIARPEYRPVLGRLVAEVVSVARAAGIRCEPLDGFDPAAFADHPDEPARTEPSWRAQHDYWAGHVQQRTGVWRDLAVHRRPTEVDHILLPIVEAGRARSVRTPALELLVELVHDVEAGRRELGWANLDALARA